MYIEGGWQTDIQKDSSAGTVKVENDLSSSHFHCCSCTAGGTECSECCSRASGTALAASLKVGHSLWIDPLSVNFIFLSLDTLGVAQNDTKLWLCSWKGRASKRVRCVRLRQTSRKAKKYNISWHLFISTVSMCEWFEWVSTLTGEVRWNEAEWREKGRKKLCVCVSLSETPLSLLPLINADVAVACANYWPVVCSHKTEET